jgi:DNA-binding MarR family transcriptional regulator
MSQESAIGESPRISQATVRDTIRQRLADEDAAGHHAADTMEVVFELGRVMSRLTRDFDSLHRQYGLTWAGFRVLNVLWAVGPSEMRQLAKLMGASRASMSSLLITLEREGFVVRTRQADDQRQVLVAFSENGRHQFDTARRAQSAREAGWFEGLQERDRSQLVRILREIGEKQMD